jgi:hypothetical protein
MQLRQLENRSRGTGRRPAGLGLRAFAFALALLALGPLSGGATGGAGDYPSPLYLSGSGSSLVAGSYQLTAAAGPSLASLTAPTATVVAGAGVTVGSYTYVYTVVDGGGESPPSAPSNTATTSSGNQQINVSGLPTGMTIRLYRRRSGLYNRVAELVNNSSPTYSDNAADPPSATVLPQSQNRVASGFVASCAVTTCGYAEFAPGGFVNTASNSALTASLSGPNGKGWIVDDSGSVHFASGNWTFTVQTKSGVAANGTAHLVVGMWKLTTAGAVVGSALVDPSVEGEQTATNLIGTSNAVKTVTHTVAGVPAFTLEAGERLYVQFWRRQTAPYVSVFNNDARVVTLYVHDDVARVEHPSVSTLPDTPTPGAPANGLVIESTSPKLRATFDDPDAGDTGTVEFRVCTLLVGGSGSDCSDLVTSGSSVSVANGTTASWTVGSALSKGTYYWQGRARDALGGQSGWSATRRFTVDDFPNVPAAVSPAKGAYVRTGTPRLRARYTDPEGESGTVSFRVCTRPAATAEACSPAVRSGKSANVGSGQTAGWVVESPLRDGVYYWQARAKDASGGSSNWSATRRFHVAKQLVRIVSSRRVTCIVGGRLSVKLRLAARAKVTASFEGDGHTDYVRRFARRGPGEEVFSFRLPYTLARPAIYWLVWRATKYGESGQMGMRVTVKPLPAGVVDPPPCTAD